MKSREGAAKIIEKLSKPQQLALAKEIARLCEKKYRSGYQQGVIDFANGDTDTGKASKFRTIGLLENYSKSVYPTNIDFKIEGFESVTSELHMNNMEILRLLYLLTSK